MLKLFFPNCSQSSFPDWYFIPSQLCSFINGLIYLKVFLDTAQSLHELMQSLPHIENICYHNFLNLWIIFLSYSIWRTNIWNTTFLFILWHLKYSKLTPSKIKSLAFIDVSNPIWYLQKSDSKISSTTSFALSWVMTSVINLQIHYMFLIGKFRRNKINCNC